MKPWFIYALLTLFCWGLWGLFSGLASAHSRPRQTLIFQAVGVIAVVLVVLSLEHFQLQRGILVVGSCRRN
jgi:transporter family protein